jgi:murein DD-endopeptidase MepM/ murein hydrolase activator NlpD
VIRRQAGRPKIRRYAHARRVRDPGPRRPSRLVVGVRIATLVLAVAAVAFGASAMLPSGGPGLDPGASPTANVFTAVESHGPPSGRSSPDGTVQPGPTASSDPSPAPLLSGYRWPLEHARITTAFAPFALGAVVVDGQRFHEGVDVASFCGDRVVAAHDGTVLGAGRHVDRWLGWVGDVAGYHAWLDAKDRWYTRAKMVVIDDGNGYRSVYMHFSSTVVVAGQQVKAGDLLGYEGATGFATGCHVHYGLFATAETAVFDSVPSLIKKHHLPAAEIARIDPLLVLPPPETADLTWAWGVAHD